MASFAVAICAPSGVGKTTVVRRLIDENGVFMFSVSATTRAARSGERPGVDYHFVSRAEFESMLATGELLEWAEVHGELYGTPRANIEQAERENKLLVLDIDVQGTRQLRAALPGTVAIFLLPPSLDVMVERLEGRGSEDRELLRKRLQTARRELTSLEGFEYVIVNDVLEETVDRVRAVVTAEQQRLIRRREEVETLREQLLQALEVPDL